MIEEYPKVTTSSPIGKALSYALPLWVNMYYYTLHGHLQIDNNAIENAIRRIALGRKNYWKASPDVRRHPSGSTECGHGILSICHRATVACKKNDINPQHWLLDVLRKLNDSDYEGKFSDLLPHRWKENLT